jgi:hypothetical protein
VYLPERYGNLEPLCYQTVISARVVVPSSYLPARSPGRAAATTFTSRPHLFIVRRKVYPEHMMRFANARNFRVVCQGLQIEAQADVDVLL